MSLPTVQDELFYKEVIIYKTKEKLKKMKVKPTKT